MEICRKNLENIFSLERENPVIYLGIQLLDPSDSCINYKGQMCICRYKEDSSGSPTLFTPRDGKFPVRQISHGDLYFVNVQFEDSGRYFCVAYNEYAVPSSRTSPSAVLNVEGKYTISRGFCLCQRKLQ